MLAGTSAGERRPATSPGPEREWYLPAHVRVPRSVRERTTAQVVAGADVLVAQTFLTHRRALARVGEARRARELTKAAVVLAREAAGQGRDRRDQETAWATAPVLVAGALPLLGEDPGSGRLGPLDAAIARDLHDHAGLLADAGVDIILVEGPRTRTETVAAIGAARSVGIETWAVVDPQALLEGPGQLGAPDMILVALGDAGSLYWPGIDESWHGAHGALVDEQSGGTAEGTGAALRAILASGASVLGIADGATPERLAVVRAAIDAHVLERAAERDVRASAWLDWVAEGAARAPTGSALWLSETPPLDLPVGWDWTVVPAQAMRTMPADRYRLVVSQGAEVDRQEIARRLEPGGVAVLAVAGEGHLPESLRTVERRATEGGTWFIGRREDR